MESPTSPHSLEEIGRLIDHIPIASDIPSNGRFMDGFTIDSQFPIENEGIAREFGLIKGSLSFRDLVRVYNKYLRQKTIVDADIRRGSWEDIIHPQRYRQLQELGCTYPVNYLLFDFCLACLDGDLGDARLYLAHSLHILGLDNSLNLLLSVIVNEGLTQDRDVTDLLVLLAKCTEPRNARSYVDTFGPSFKSRYGLYMSELKKLG